VRKYFEKGTFSLEERPAVNEMIETWRKQLNLLRDTRQQLCSKCRSLHTADDCINNQLQSDKDLM
jgi:hypothetical protein